MLVWLCVCACVCVLRGDAALLPPPPPPPPPPAPLRAVLDNVAEKVEDLHEDLAKAINETVSHVVCLMGGGGVRRCSGMPPPRMPPLRPLEDLLPLPRAAPEPPHDLGRYPLTLQTLVRAVFDASEQTSDHASTTDKGTATHDAHADNSAPRGDEPEKDADVGVGESAKDAKETKDKPKKEAEDKAHKDANSTENAEENHAANKKKEVVDSTVHAADSTTLGNSTSEENANPDETNSEESKQQVLKSKKLKAD